MITSSLSPMLPGWLPIRSTRAAVDKISHLVVLRPRSAVPWCFSVISCGVSVACSSAHHPPFFSASPADVAASGFLSYPLVCLLSLTFWLQLFLSTYKWLSAPKAFWVFSLIYVLSLIDNIKSVAEKHHPRAEGLSLSLCSLSLSPWAP